MDPSPLPKAIAVAIAVYFEHCTIPGLFSSSYRSAPFDGSCRTWRNPVQPHRRGPHTPGRAPQYCNHPPRTDQATRAHLSRNTRLEETIINKGQETVDQRK